MLHTLSAVELKSRFLSGSLSAVEIARHFLDRIEKENEKVGAFLSVHHERALAKAKDLDEKRAAKKPLGKLAGIPIAVKDNIHIKGEITTCSSKFLTNYKAPFEATVTRLMEDEDALLIGKTNLDEFAMGSSTENSAFFPSRNPWNTGYTPGGSSGGSAAAVSARLSPLALGSDTGGSIRQPAGLCGIVGFKPTYGRVSRFGLVAFGSSLDQIGPFAATTSDAALLMEVIGRHCAKDSTSIPMGPESYLENMKRTSLKGLKVGVPYSFLEQLSAEPRAVFDKAVEDLKQLGAEPVAVDLDLLKYSIAVYYILATAEASTNLARFDGVRYGVRSPRAKTLDEVYDLSKDEGYGDEVKRRILLGTYVLSAGYQDAYYKKAQRVRTLMIRQFAAAFKACDFIAMPVTPGGTFEFGAIKDPVTMYLEDIYTIGANLAGIPAISLPCGTVEGWKPYGLQILGPQKQDAFVFEVAHAYEQATTHHKRVPEIAL